MWAFLGKAYLWMFGVATCAYYTAVTLNGAAQTSVSSRSILSACADSWIQHVGFNGHKRLVEAVNDNTNEAQFPERDGVYSRFDTFGRSFPALCNCAYRRGCRISIFPFLGSMPLLCIGGSRTIHNSWSNEGQTHCDDA